MRRAVVASVAGLGVVGSLAVPVLAPMATPIASAALLPPEPAEARLIFSGVPVVDSADTADDIWDVVPDGSDEPTRRVDSEAPASAGIFGYREPSYSADGTRAVFVANLDSEELGAGFRLMTIDLTDPLATPQLVDPTVPDNTDEGEPDWSADGSRIAFVRDIYDEDSEEFTGMRLRILDVASGQVNDPFAGTPIDYDDVIGQVPSSPALSPDGDRLLFTSLDEADSGRLWLLDLEEDELFEVSADAGSGLESLSAQGPSWSADGERIVWVDATESRTRLVAGELGATAEGPDHARVVVAPDVLLPEDPTAPRLSQIRDPAWSPDGSEIAVVAQDGATSASVNGIYAVDVEDSTISAITVAPYGPTGGPWDADLRSPDYQPWSDLEVALTATPSAGVEVGDRVDLTATVTNTGASPAWGVEVEFELPGAEEGLELGVAWPAECDGDGGYRSCVLSEPLAPEESVELTVSVVFTEPGGFTADSRVTADTVDPVTANNVASLPFEVDFPPATGIEPRLALGHEYDSFGDRQADLADLLAADATDFRVLVDELVTDADGGTHRPAERHPSYAPDGRRIVLSSALHELLPEGGGWYTPSGAALFVGDVGPGPGPATNLEMLDYDHSEGLFDLDPVWSPDGTRIAFRRSQGNSAAQIAVVDVDVPGAVTRIIQPDAWESGASVGTMSWSPDGERLVVETGSGLWVVHVDDGTAAPVFTEITDACGSLPSCLVQLDGSEPAWSPDGTRITYVEPVSEGGWELYTVAIGEMAAGYVVPAPLIVTALDGVDLVELEAPTWSLDSGFVTFVGRSNEESPGVLLTVPATGGAPTVLRDTFPGAFSDVTDPVYQPWADVGVELSAEPGHVDRPLVVSATVTNDGPSPAWGTVVTLEVPAVAAGEAVLESWPEACEADGALLACTPPAESLPVGTAVTWDVVLRFTEPGTHAVQARVATRSIDPEPGDNATVLSVGVAALPDSLAEPHLAFTRRAVQDPLDASADVADVPAQRGPVEVARLLAHEGVTTTDGQVLHPDESHPSYSPDGSRLVFHATTLVDDPTSSAGQQMSGATRLFVGDLVPDPVPGNEPALVDIEPLVYEVDAFAADSEAAWSPDGTRIAFTRETDLDFGRSVHILDVETGDVRELSAPGIDGAESIAPSWSPGGDRLVVEMRIMGEATELWIVHLDPAGDTWFPVGTVAPSCDADPLDCLSPWEGFAPAWSPDGGRLAAGDAPLYEGGPEWFSAIEVLDIPDAPSGGFYGVGASSVLVGTPMFWDGDLPPGQLHAAWHPAWSPDGSQVSFVGRATSESYDALYAIGAAGGEPQVRVAEWSEERPGSYADPAYQPAAGDVAITLDAPAEVGVDVPTDLTATVTNGGPGPASGITVSFDLPPRHRVVDLPAGCSVVASGVTCVVEDPLPTGEEGEVTISVAFGETGPLDVTGVVTTATYDPEPADDTDIVRIDVLPVRPATGIEPRLAFTYVVDTPQELAPDLADVFWADGEDFRVIADERVSDPGGQHHRASESDPSYSPDGRQMVFSAERELYGYEDSTGAPGYGIDGQAVLMIGETRPGPTGLVDVGPLDYDRPAGARDVEPVWSPDGTRIAFVRSVEEDIRLAVVDVATGAVRYVEGLPYWISDPSWSPDGRRLVVDATDGQGSLWIVHVDGDDVFPVVVADPLCDPAASSCPSVSHEPSWSPDGTRVAFLDRYATAADEYVDGLFTVEMPAAPVAGEYRTGPAHRVVGADPSSSEPAERLTDLRSPAWSLDGTSLAFVERGNDDGARDVIHTVPADGGTPRVLRDEVRGGLEHGFSDLVHQPWADVGVTVTTSAPTADSGELLDITVTVTNHGPSPAWGTAVDVTLPDDVGQPATLPAGCTGTAGALTCTAGEVMPVGDTWTFTFTVVAPAAGSHETVAEVTSRMIDPVPENDADAAAFDVAEAPVLALLTDVAITLELGQSTGWVGGDPIPATVVVTNNGPGAAAGVGVVLMTPAFLTPDPTAPTCAAGSPCDLGALAAGQSRTIVVDLGPTDAGTGTATAAVTSTTQDTDPRNDTAVADLEVLQPTLRLLPSVATPGEATLAYGVDFPPGAQLTLEWSRGITPWLRPVTVREDGTVRSPLLILPGDELGERVATASGTAGPGFGDVEAPPMLVVPRTYSPPNFLTRG